MLTQEIELAKERLCAQIEVNASKANIALSLKLLAFAHKYRIIKYSPGFDLKRFTETVEGIEQAIRHIVGVRSVYVRKRGGWVSHIGWRIPPRYFQEALMAEVRIDQMYFDNLIFNNEMREEIRDIMKILYPNANSFQVIIYPYSL